MPAPNVSQPVPPDTANFSKVGGFFGAGLDDVSEWIGHIIELFLIGPLFPPRGK